MVSLGATPIRPVLEETLAELEERAARAGSSSAGCEEDVELAVRPRMLRVVARNLAENAIRYAGPGATFTLAVERDSDGAVVLAGRDDGVGVEEAELPRSSSGSSGPTAPAPHGGRASASRSSSTS